MFTQRDSKQTSLAAVVDLKKYAQEQKQKQVKLENERRECSTVNTLQLRLSLIEEERKKRFLTYANEITKLF